MDTQETPIVYLLSQRDADRVYFLIESLGSLVQQLFSLRSHAFPRRAEEILTDYQDCFAECAASIEEDIEAENAIKSATDNIPPF